MESLEIAFGRKLQLNITSMLPSSKGEQQCSAKNTGTRICLSLTSSMESTRRWRIDMQVVNLMISLWRRFVQSRRNLWKRNDHSHWNIGGWQWRTNLNGLELTQFMKCKRGLSWIHLVLTPLLHLKTHMTHLLNRGDRKWEMQPNLRRRKENRSVQKEVFLQRKACKSLMNYNYRSLWLLKNGWSSISSSCSWWQECWK